MKTAMACSLVEVHIASTFRVKEEKAFSHVQVSRLVAWFLLVNCLPYISNLKMVAVYGSETSVKF
jgi:hypothetical protein